MIKLNESKLCMMNGGGDDGRGEEWWLGWLPALLVFFVFATADDEIRCKIVGPCLRAKPGATTDHYYYTSRK